MTPGPYSSPTDRAQNTHLQLARTPLYIVRGFRTAGGLIQEILRGALNLNVHFHMLFLDGAYIDFDHGPARFRRVKAPTNSELTQLTCTIAQRVGRYLERQALMMRDARNSYFTATGVARRS